MKSEQKKKRERIASFNGITIFTCMFNENFIHTRKKKRLYFQIQLFPHNILMMAMDWKVLNSSGIIFFATISLLWLKSHFIFVFQMLGAAE